MMEILRSILEIARDAGATILRYYHQGPGDVEIKADGSPVTAADREADQQIRDALFKLDRSIPFISEEGEIPELKSDRTGGGSGWSTPWTDEGIRGRTDEFTVNVALIDGGIPVLGVVYAPAMGVMYSAESGGGTWKQDPDGTSRRLVSTFPNPTNALTVAESRSHPSPAMEALLKPYRIKARIAAGSSLKFDLLAEGTADIYPRLGPTMEWDVAAGDCVYRFSRLHGSHPVELRYNTPRLRNDGFVIGLEPGTFELPSPK